MDKKNVSQNGFVALITLLVIVALVILIGVSTSLLSINDLQSAFAGKRSEEIVNILEACVEDVLLTLNETNTLPSSVTIPPSGILPQVVCSVIMNSHVGNNWDFTVSGAVDNYAKKVQIQAVRDTSVSITSWEEVN